MQKQILSSVQRIEGKRSKLPEIYIRLFPDRDCVLFLMVCGADAARVLRHASVLKIA
jgi:hypothetical protein